MALGVIDDNGAAKLLRRTDHGTKGFQVRRVEGADRIIVLLRIL